MNVAFGIVSRKVEKISSIYRNRIEKELIPERKPIDEKVQSIAFTLLVISEVLRIDIDDAFEYITEGGNDGGIDAIHVSSINNQEFYISIFQSKFSKNGGKSFPENEILKIKNTIDYIFSIEGKKKFNDRLTKHIENIRSISDDENKPYIRVYLCNNGEKWSSEAQPIIDDIEKNNFGQVSFEHINHDTLGKISESKQPLDEKLKLRGQFIVESFTYTRAIIGKMCVTDIKDLFDRRGHVLLDRNIRYFLGTKHGQVNVEIAHTLKNENKRNNFYYYNNGITMICEDLTYDAIKNNAGRDSIVDVKNLHIINGGQTCSVITEVLSKDHTANYDNTYVLVRLYEIKKLSKSNERFIYEVTYATNNQNPIDLSDLHSNDVIQENIEKSLEQLGWVYKRKSGQTYTNCNQSKVFTSQFAAKAILSIWNRSPNITSSQPDKIFTHEYEKIFSDKLFGEQVVIACLILRKVEEYTRFEISASAKSTRLLSFLKYYGSYHLSMIIGDILIKRVGAKIDNKNFEIALEFIQKGFSSLLEEASEILSDALSNVFVDETNRSKLIKSLASVAKEKELLNWINKILSKKKII